MPDLKKMTLERLRELARKALGPGASALKTKAELVRALEKVAGARAKAGPEAEARPRTRPAGRASAAKGKAVRAVKAATKAGREAVVRAGQAAAQGARAGRKVAKARKGGPVTEAAAAAVGAVAGLASAAVKRARGTPPEGLPDLEGYFVARVRGEDAAREAPHPMAEAGKDEPYPRWVEGVGAPLYEESLGELPWGYGDDAFVALPRDPRTLFLYWDLSRDTVERGFEGMDHGRAQLWIFARAGEGWERVRTIDFALESRSYYVHELEPGRTYRAEIHALDRQGRDRLVGRSSNAMTLPPVGPSPIVDDRFARIPWDMPLGRLLGPGHAGGPFSDEARRLLERLSDWTRFAGETWGSAGGMGGRPFSPTSSPSSPARPRGSGDDR